MVKICKITNTSFKFTRFTLLAQSKKLISMRYGCNMRSSKPWRWVKLNLTFTMRDIYISSNLNPLTKFTSSSRSTEFKDILQWNIFQMIMKTVPMKCNEMGQNIQKSYYNIFSIDSALTVPLVPLKFTF